MIPSPLLFPEALPALTFQAWQALQQLQAGDDPRQILVDKLGWSPQVAGGCLARLKKHGLLPTPPDK